MKRTIIYTVLIIIPALLSAQDDSLILLEKAFASYYQGQYGAALEDARTGAMLADDYRFYLVAGNSLLAQGMTGEAAEEYKKAESIAPGSAAYMLAALSAMKGDASECVSYMKKNLESEYKRPQAEILLDKRFSKVEGSPEWKALWKRDWYTELDRSVAEMKYLVKSGRYEELGSLEARTGELYRGEPAMEYLGAVASSYRGEYTKALEHYRRAIDAGISDRDMWLGFMELLVERGEYAEAASVAAKALKAWPAEADMMVIRTESLRRMGDREKAAEELSHITSLYPSNSEALLLESRVAFEMNEYTKALKQVSKAIDKFPGNADAYVLRGDIYNRTGTWEYALNDYAMSLDLSPGNGDVYYSKGMLLIKTGSKVDGCRDLRMALKYGNRKAGQEINRYCIR